MEKTRRSYYKRSEEFVPKVYNSTDLAYMAGIIDGEGCFYIGKVAPNRADGYVSDHYRGLLKIDNTDHKLIDWLNTVFSGSNSAANRATSSKKFTRDVYSWIATGDRLLDLCEQILPYLVIKKQHCLVMIKFRKSYTTRLGSTKVSPEALEIRKLCLEEIRQLNSRWHLHPLKQNSENSSLAPVTGS
jgi:hypothetical protein